jgi:glycosyltransferase involved in cell wall biosynthesis
VFARKIKTGWNILKVCICGVVVLARDEEKVIGKCLESLRNQKIQLYIVVVNDGSIDRTREIALKFADVVVDLPRHEDSWVGRPELARVFNSGFEILRDKKCDYVLISGADATYSANYVDEIIKMMKTDNVTLASGIALGESVTDLSPRGCGRIIEDGWFRRVGYKYPENYGFEAYIIFKALSEGDEVKVYRNIYFELSRKTQFSNKKMISWGKGMKALNYWWFYALGRAILIGIRHPLGGYNLLKGYFSDVPLYEDIKKFVPRMNKKIITRRIKDVLKIG